MAEQEGRAPPALIVECGMEVRDDVRSPVPALVHINPAKDKARKV